MTSTAPGLGVTALSAIALTNQDKALRQLNRCVETHPDDVLALYLRALIWTSKQEWSAAIADYEAAIRIRPEDPSLHFNCGVVAWRSGDAAATVEHMLRARDLDPTCEGAHYYLALARHAQGRTLEALTMARRALELRPTECSIGAAEFVGLIDLLETTLDRG
ncbi:tetratricopeptide repeat protein [Actinomadura luteofluorescens]|uniref:tetratricopeptide repeat protein n=1 Tax=Actinomadura luteofluorescens TaxID=46163 RepID=UPI0030D22720